MLSQEYLSATDANEFKKTQPFPFKSFRGFLQPEVFARLDHDFPSFEFFEKHTGIERPAGQRPHDRYYLAYANSVYRQVARSDKGIVQHGELPESWQQFIDYLRTDPAYRSFLAERLGYENFEMRFAWHIGVRGSEVSPHLDAAEKVGTHIFYFNRSQNWNYDWGGHTLVLGGVSGKQTLNPDFSEFSSQIECGITDNQSFLFKNTPRAWHGVKTLTCPDDSQGRRLFNVICEVPGARKGRGQKLIDMILMRKNKNVSDFPTY